MSSMKISPIQKALKLPETKPDRIFREGPPSREAARVSRTCLDLGLVNNLVNSGISAAPRVPQLMMVDKVTQRYPGRSPIR